MRIAITGAAGQLGATLCQVLEASHQIIPLSHAQLELGSPEATAQIVATNADLVIHSAAYTNVDGCARDPELAYRINGLGTQYVALACQRLKAPLVYISTNEIFAGDATRPYVEYDQAGPVNAYGRSKWAGEQAVRELLDQFYIVRVSWLFGGARNFVRTVLRLGQQPPEGSIRMVDDEIGSPAYTPDVAHAVSQLITSEHYGAYHFVNEGSCSRYAFARTILEMAGHSNPPITAIKLADYQRDSTPPPYAPLANIAGAALGIRLPSWQDALATYLTTLQ